MLDGAEGGQIIDGRELFAPPGEVVEHVTLPVSRVRRRILQRHDAFAFLERQRRREVLAEDSNAVAPTAIATAMANPPMSVNPRYTTSIRTPSRVSVEMASSHWRPRASRPASLCFSIPPKRT